MFQEIIQELTNNHDQIITKFQRPTQPRSLPISIGRGIGEQRGKINVGCLL